MDLEIMREWGVQPHNEGETRSVTTYIDDVLNARSLLPEVLLLPPPIKESGDDAAPTTANLRHA